MPMSNFIGLVFSTLKKAGIDTKNMDVDEALAEYNKLTSNKKSANITLDKKEYGKVAHTVATKFADKKVSSTYIHFDNYMYLVTDIAPGKFNVKAKINIEEYKDYIELLEEDDDK